jgi:HEAT repeat protein
MEVQVCPDCGADIAALSARDYADKLIAALHQPLADVRMRVIIALGWRGEARAAQPLLELTLRHPVDVVEGLAVVESLKKLGTEGRIALSDLAQRHPAHAVREAAKKAHKVDKLPGKKADHQ